MEVVAMVRELRFTGRTALTPNGSERVFETWVETGVFAGASYELLESELGARDGAVAVATCGHCGRSWNDAAVTSMTPVPAGRCPFEADHEYDGG